MKDNHTDLQPLIDAARELVMTTEEREAQTRSFAAGNVVLSQLPPIPTAQQILGPWVGHPRLARLRESAATDLGRNDVGAYIHWLERALLEATDADR